MADHKPLIRAANAADAEAVACVHLAAFEGDAEARLVREVPVLALGPIAVL